MVELADMVWCLWHHLLIILDALQGVHGMAGTVLECISVQDPIDAISEYKKKVPPYTKLIGESTVEKISVGIPKKYFFDYLEPEVEHVFYNFIDTIKLMDIPVYEEINLHDTEKYYVSWRDIRLAERQQKFIWIG